MPVTAQWTQVSLRHFATAYQATNWLRNPSSHQMYALTLSLAGDHEPDTSNPVQPFGTAFCPDLAGDFDSDNIIQRPRPPPHPMHPAAHAGLSPNFSRPSVSPMCTPALRATKRSPQKKRGPLKEAKKKQSFCCFQFISLSFTMICPKRPTPLVGRTQRHGSRRRKDDTHKSRCACWTNRSHRSQ